LKARRTTQRARVNPAELEVARPSGNVRSSAVVVECGDYSAAFEFRRPDQKAIVLSPWQFTVATVALGLAVEHPGEFS
jgi:hypothetical protein